MFSKLTSTQFPPKEKPVMVWDGNCGFCLYWTTKWSKVTLNKVEYLPYQIAKDQFTDIEEFHFTEASRLIDMDGRIYSGPQSAYKTLTFGSKWAFLNQWYEKNKIFSRFSDLLYHLVAKNRNILFRLSKLSFGSNPQVSRPFWIVYLAIALYFLYV